MNYGWLCSGCGRGYSPYAYQCGYCGPQIEVTSGTAPPCDHAWIYTTAGQNCGKCGLRIEPMPLPLTTALDEEDGK